MVPPHPPIPTSVANDPAHASAVETSSPRPVYGSYNLPDDDQERARLDLQHELLRATFGGMLYLSPLPNPRSILDVGTGTGVWGSDMAQQFPHAKLVGFDLNPKIPPNLPENFRYAVGDFEDPWPFEEATFDFVHARMVVIAVKDHRQFIRQALKTLQPGGWFELQDLSVPFANTTGLMAEWNDYYLEGNRKLGLNMSAAEHGWEEWLQDAGFENVQHRKFEWHFASVPTDAEATKLARLARTNLNNALEGISTRVFTQGLGWSKADLDAYLEKIRGAIEEMPGETYLPIHAIYAQKPHSV